MKYLILAVIGLAAAMMLGYFLQQDPGFIIVGYGGKFFRMSFVPFAVMTIIATLVIYLSAKLFFRLFSVGKRWRSWSDGLHHKRSHRALGDGLIALASGDYVRAENLLSRGAKHDPTPGVHWLAAAEAAHAQKALDRRDQYLAKAGQSDRKAEAAIGIKRARMQLEFGQLEQARATVEYLSDRYPDNRQILCLRSEVYRADNDWQAIASLLPAMRRHKALENGALEQLETETALALFNDYFASLEALTATWEKLPKSTRENAVVVAKYAQCLAAFGQHEVAEALIRKALGRAWHRDLIIAYRRVRIPNGDLQFERAQNWLKERPDDPDLLITLASLAVTAANWLDARTYLDRLNKSQATPEAYQLLADVLEHEGNPAEASRCRRDGLAMALGAAPLNRVNLPVVVPAND